MSDTFVTVNPATGESIGSHRHLNIQQVIERLERSDLAFKKWSHLSLEERQKLLVKLAENLHDNKELLATRMTTEMGKPITQSRAEVDKCIQAIHFCVQESTSALAPEIHNGFKIYNCAQGVILGIMPWNFPLWQVLRFAVPPLLVGNTILLKHADCVAGTAELLHDLIHQVLPADVYINTPMDHTLVRSLLADKRLRGVSLTGSTRAGISVAQQAGTYLKKVVLELGGNDSYIVCEDAELDSAVEKVFQGRALNAGQSCISAKRLFVHESLFDGFQKKLIQHLESLVLADPLKETTTMGPIARQDLCENLYRQVEDMKSRGAQDVYKYKNQPQRGFFFPPTLMDCRQMKSYDEEVFGPVFSLFSFKTDDEALALANQSPYGLGGAVFSKDLARAERLAVALDTGSVAINDFFRSAPERPFGGVKHSGCGRELGREGFYEFVNRKVIVSST